MFSALMSKRIQTGNTAEVQFEIQSASERCWENCQDQDKYAMSFGGVGQAF